MLFSLVNYKFPQLYYVLIEYYFVTYFINMVFNKTKLSGEI